MHERIGSRFGRAEVRKRVRRFLQGLLAPVERKSAFAAGVPAEWVVGDTVYGYDEMRSWLEEQERNYVLAVPETHLVRWRLSCLLMPGRCSL